MKKFFKITCSAAMALMLSACASMNNNEAAPERFSDLHFDNKAPIQLNVKKIEVKVFLFPLRSLI